MSVSRTLNSSLSIISLIACPICPLAPHIQIFRIISSSFKLSFLHDLGEVCQDSRCFIFWEKEEAIHHDELLEHYLDGLKMLMSIGYELRIDTIKNHTEIPNRLSLEDLFLKIYQSMMNVSSTYSSQDYQNTIDDYFSLGFQLGIDLDEIIDHI